MAGATLFCGVIMFGWLSVFTQSQITNLVQTLGAMFFATLSAKGYLNADAQAALLNAVPAVVLLGYNILNHNQALATPPASTGTSVNPPSKS